MKRVISARSRAAALGSPHGTSPRGPRSVSSGGRGMKVFSRFVVLFGLRAEFPVLRRIAYLNAGTDGPLPARALSAVAEELEREAADGRTMAHFERRSE